MVKNDQFDRLNKNYDELENDKKETLLKIGENLLNIQGLINKEKSQGINVSPHCEAIQYNSPLTRRKRT